MGRFTTRSTIVSGGGGGSSGDYFGFNPTIYAHPSAAQGTGTGASEANAMTLADALTTATAGHVIGVLPGIATRAHGGGKYPPAYLPTNQGTSGNPIRIVAKRPWTETANRVELRTNATLNSTPNASPTIGSHQRNYVEWYGMYVDEANAKNQGDSGTAMISECTGVKVMYCRLISETAHTPADNHVGVYFNECFDSVVERNTISGYRSSSFGSPNGAGMMEYGNANGTIRYNYIYDCGSGIYTKGRPGTNWNYGLRSRNRIHACNIGMDVMAIDPTSQLIIEHSLFTNSVDSAMLFNTSAGADTGRNIVVRRNTMYSDVNGFAVNSITGAGNEFNDNLVVISSGSQPYIDCAGYTGNNFTNFDYNGFYGSGAANPWGWNGANQATIAAFHAACANSNNNQVLANDPLSGRGSGDYTVTGTATTASSTGGPIGAQYSIVGPDAP